MTTLAGEVGGAGKLILSGAMTIFSAGADASVAALALQTGANVYLQTSMSYAGALTQATGSRLALIAGLNLTLTGTSLFNGAILGAGATLDLNGGSATFDAAATFGVGRMKSEGAALTFSGAHGYTGAFVAAAETITLDAQVILGGQSSLTGVTLDGAGQFRLKAATYVSDGLTLGGGSGLVNAGALTQGGGDVTLGDATGDAVRLANTGPGAIWNFIDDSGIALADGTTASATNSGLIEKSGGTGTSAIAVALSNYGVLKALSGALDLIGAITGKGTALVSGASTLAFGGSVANTQTVQFSGAGSTLRLADFGAFGAAISGFDLGAASGDTIEVTGPWAFVGFHATTSLLTFDDAGAQHSVKLTGGTYDPTHFHAAVSGGATYVTYA